MIGCVFGRRGLLLARSCWMLGWLSAFVLIGSTPASAARGDAPGFAVASPQQRVADGVIVQASLSSDLLSLSGPPETATLTLTTGSTPSTAAVGVEPSLWPDPHVFGSPLRLSGPMIGGAGVMTGTYTSSGSASARGASRCVRGAPPYEGSGIDLALPADSTTTVTWSVSLAAPPWAFAPTRLGWIVGVPATADDPQREITQRQVRPLRIHIEGLLGVRIALRAGTGSHRAPKGSLPYRQVQVGSTATIVGQTRPTTPHTRIVLGSIDTITHHRHTIGSVVTNARGAFRIKWRPRHPGVKTITATLAKPSAGDTAGHNCDLALAVTQ